MKKFLALILSVAMIFALVACGSKEGDTPNTDGDTQQTDTPAAPVDIVIATGGTTGTYYAVGNALVTTIGDKLSLSKLTAVDSGASKANVQLVTAGQAQMSILQSDVLNYAHNGSGGETMFDGAADKNSLWVAGVYNETVQLVTAPSITSIEDLKGKTVCVGDVGSGTALNAAQVLEAYGMTFDDIKVMYDSFSGGAEALKNGQCDAAFTVSGAPTPALTDLATAYNFNMPSLSDEAVSYLTTNYPFLVQDNLPANTYTCVADETVCVAVKAVFTASKDLSEDVVYEITKAMFDNQADLAKAQAKFGFLSPEGAVAGSFDLHPGAEKYYKEIGVLSEHPILKECESATATTHKHGRCNSLDYCSGLPLDSPRRLLPDAPQ